jgi:acetate kinase
MSDAPLPQPPPGETRGHHRYEALIAACRDLAWLGIELDEAANAAHARCISTTASRVAVYVIPTDEEVVIAREACAALAGVI